MNRQRRNIVLARSILTPIAVAGAGILGSVVFASAANAATAGSATVRPQAYGWALWGDFNQGVSG